MCFENESRNFSEISFRFEFCKNERRVEENRFTTPVKKYNGGGKRNMNSLIELSTIEVIVCRVTPIKCLNLIIQRAKIMGGVQINVCQQNAG